MTENKGRKQSSLLQVRDLRCHIPLRDGLVKAVDGVDFDLCRGEPIGIVGESGSGKTITALTLMGLAPAFSRREIHGEMWFKGRDLFKLSPRDWTKVRGKEISMIFQEPMTSLNPTLSIGYQIREVIVQHEKADDKMANEKAAALLEMVKIPSPHRMLSRYPHQLSGGMRQRAMIAMALACRPEILIADEPTTALDVTVQAQIMELIEQLQQEVGTAVILITHNLGLLAQFASRILVMYLGRVLECATTYALFDYPRHPYTRGLLAAVPKMGNRSESGKRKSLAEIKGTIPNPLSAPKGCKFHPRCQDAKAKCMENEPDLVSIGDGHQVRCWMSS